MHIKDHLAYLKEAVDDHHDEIFFKAPLESSTPSWRSISYAQFWGHVQACAVYWARIFSGEGIESKAVVAIWLQGSSYIDYVSFFALPLAGYVPHFIDLSLSDPATVNELIINSGAKAILVEPSNFTFTFGDIKTFTPMPLESMPIIDPGDYLPVQPPSGPEEVKFMALSSGSSGRLPKIIRYTARFIYGFILRLKDLMPPSPPSSLEQNVFLLVTPATRISSWTFMFSALRSGGAVILPSKFDYSVMIERELGIMIDEYGLNRLNAFPPVLSKVFRMVEMDESGVWLKRLQSCRHVLYGGLAFDPKDVAWGYRNGLKLGNIFGSCEIGFPIHATSATQDGIDEMKVVSTPGFKYEFRAMEPAPDDPRQLFQLVVLPDSLDIPHPSLLAPDGCFQTGDLFEASPTKQGVYYTMGRMDDWIKLAPGGKCDTKSIEENVRETCADLVQECVVVGNGRPKPGMLVEPTMAPNSEVLDKQKLAREVLERISSFHRKRYRHEQITDEALIIVVDPGTLPRSNKGNVRRRNAELQFKDKLNEAYARLG